MFKLFTVISNDAKVATLPLSADDKLSKKVADLRFEICFLKESFSFETF